MSEGDKPAEAGGAAADGPGDRDGLNPALKRRTDATHPTQGSSPAPAQSASVQREEGRSWPLIWAVVTIAGVLIALWILVF